MKPQRPDYRLDIPMDGMTQKRKPKGPGPCPMLLTIDGTAYAPDECMRTGNLIRMSFPIALDVAFPSELRWHDDRGRVHRLELQCVSQTKDRTGQVTTTIEGITRGW